MKITPLDIQKQVFRKVVRGLDPDEVQTFLFLVAEELESTIREKLSLDAEVKKLREITLDHEERERILKETLLTTQKVSEHLRESAKKEAELIVRDAEFRAEQVIEKAQTRAAKIQESMTEIRLLRDQLRIRLKSQIQTVGHLLEAQEAADREDDKVTYLRRAEGGAAEDLEDG